MQPEKYPIADVTKCIIQGPDAYSQNVLVKRKRNDKWIYCVR